MHTSNRAKPIRGRAASTRCTPIVPVSLSAVGRPSRLGGTSPVILAGSAYFSTNTSVDHYPHSPRLARPGASDATPPPRTLLHTIAGWQSRACTRDTAPREAPGISCNMLYGKSLHSDLQSPEESDRSIKADSSRMYYISHKVIVSVM